MAYAATETPEKIADMMVAIAGVQPGWTVLEPSAGRGALARAAFKRKASVTCIELNSALAHEIGVQGFHVIRGDFLKISQCAIFDAVLMNPPMAAISHILHALDAISPGGVLVALVHSINMKNADLLDVLTKMKHEWHPLPIDTFEFNNAPIACGILKVQL